jgi:glycosyltransferase involved in cell wall biosynthesis
VSESNLKCIKQLNVKTHVKVIPNGFNDKLFYSRDSKNCRNTLNLPLDKKIILTVGYLIEIKGHKYLVDAIGEVVKHRKDILCIIVGSGELKNKLQKQIKKTGLENSIILAGGRPHDEIPIWMNACDVFVLPSLRESFGVVQIEVLACGKPVVSTYNGGSEEIITSKEYGILVEPANSKKLAEAILIALDKDWNNETIKKYAEQYNYERISEEIMKIYNDVSK